MKPLIVATLLLATSFAASAENQNYLGMSGGISTYTESGISNDFDMFSLGGSLGTKFNEYLSAELRIGSSVKTQEIVEGIEVNMRVKNYYGAYFKGFIPIDEKISPYGILGYTKGTFELETFMGAVEVKESDVSFGLGIDLSLNTKSDINVEYISLIEKDGGELSSISFGFVFDI